jgi:hypothetical protein
LDVHRYRGIDLDARRVHHQILDPQAGEVPVNPKPVPASLVATDHRRVTERRPRRPVAAGDRGRGVRDRAALRTV